MTDKSGEDHGEEKPRISPVDMSFLKDIGDIIRARNQYFVPFYGAFLAFLVSKTDYVKTACFITQLLMAVTFFLGLIYAYILSSFISSLETMRLAFSMKANALLGQYFGNSVMAGFQPMIIRLSKNLNLERRLYGWTMYLLWMSTISALNELFFNISLCQSLRILIPLIRRFGGQ